MVADDGRQISRKAPIGGQDIATFTVRQSEHLLFRVVQGDTFAAGEFKCLAELQREDPQIHQNAKIVKQASKVNLAGVWKSDPLREMTTDQRASHRVLP